MLGKGRRLLRVDLEVLRIGATVEVGAAQVEALPVPVLLALPLRALHEINHEVLARVLRLRRQIDDHHARGHGGVSGVEGRQEN